MDQGVCVNGIVLNHDNEVLLVKRSQNDSAFPESWELPGGSLEHEERMPNALKRELKEECGLTVEVIKPLTTNNFSIGATQYLETTFLCNVTDHIYTIALSNEHTEYKWIKFDELDKAGLSDYMKKTLRDSEKALKFTK